MGLLVTQTEYIKLIGTSFIEVADNTYRVTAKIAHYSDETKELLINYEDIEFENITLEIVMQGIPAIYGLISQKFSNPINIL